MFGLFKKKEEEEKIIKEITEFRTCKYCGIKSHEVNINYSWEYKCICDKCNSLHNHKEGILVLDLFNSSKLTKSEFLNLRNKISKKIELNHKKKTEAKTKKELLQVKKIKKKYGIKY